MARVLVVEDETAVLLFAEIVLEGLGHSIVSVSSQTDALALLEGDDVDVLFTDIRLPESDLAGFELARQAREQHPSLKVLYTTGQTIDDRMKALYVDGATMLPNGHSLAEAVVDAIREPLLVLHFDLRVIAASRSFYRTFAVTPRKTEGRLLFELGDGQWNIPKLRTILEVSDAPQRRGL